MGDKLEMAQTSNSSLGTIEDVQIAYAANDYSRVIEICSSHPTGSAIGQFDLFRAAAQFELGHVNEAIGALDDYIEHSGDDCHAPVQRLKLSYLAGHWSEVLEWGLIILRNPIWYVSPSQVPGIRVMVGIAYLESGREMESLLMFRELDKDRGELTSTFMRDLKRSVSRKRSHREFHLYTVYRPSLQLLPK